MNLEKSNVPILIVEDEVIVAMMFKLKLENMGYSNSFFVSKGIEAVRMTQELSPALILMDIHLKGDMDGVESVEMIRKRSDVPVIFVTGDFSKETKERVLGLQPYAYLQKPFMDEELDNLIRSMLSSSSFMVIPS